MTSIPLMGQRVRMDEVRCRVGKREGGKKVEVVSVSQAYLFA
jgi:hypothetical protein